MKQTWVERLRAEWWFRVSRHFEPDNLCWRIAWLIPRKIALLVFIRVFSAGDLGPDHLDVYEKLYKAWKAGARAVISRKPKGPTAKRRATKARTRRTAETAIMLEARARDGWARFPDSVPWWCEPTEVAHQEHRGMGGDPKMARTTRKTLLLLSRKRHKEHKFSVDQKSLKWEPLTSDGTDGPIRWWVKIDRLPAAFVEARALCAVVDEWLLLATESAPHVYLPFTEEQQAVLKLIQ